MEQVSDKDGFEIILSSDEIDCSSEYWKIQCKYLYDELKFALPKGFVTPSTHEDSFEEKNGNILYSNIVVNELAVKDWGVLILDILYYWLKNTKDANIELKFPNELKIKITNQNFVYIVVYFNKLKWVNGEIEKKLVDLEFKIGAEEEFKNTMLDLMPLRINDIVSYFPKNNFRHVIFIDRQNYGGIEEYSQKIYNPYEISHEINKILTYEFNRLSKGQIVFNVSKIMKTGVSEKASAFISKDLSKIYEKVNNYSLLRDIKISPSMKVSLKGEGDNFNIQQITSEVQPIIEGEVTTWDWTVKPLKSGKQNLYLSVDVIIEVPHHSDKEYSLPTLEEKIEVKVNPKYFVECHLGAIVGAIIGIATLSVAILTFIYKK